MDFEVVAEELHTCADQAGSAGEQAGRLHPDDVLLGAVTGIPGADAALLIHQVREKWRHDLDSWAAYAAGYAYKLDVAADTYRRGDDLSGSAFTDLGRTLP